MVVSTRSTDPCLSYILIELPATRCLTRIPSGRCFKSLTTCFWNCGLTPVAGTLRPRNRITSRLPKLPMAACRTKLARIQFGQQTRRTEHHLAGSLAHSLSSSDQ